MRVSHLLLTASALLLLNGCTIASMEKRVEKYSVEVKEDLKKFDHSTSLTSIKEIEIPQSKVDISAGVLLSDALLQIGNIEGKVYYLASQDIEIPAISNSEKVVVNSFNSLNNLLQDITSYKMVIVKNKFLNNRPKVIKLIDTKIEQSDLSKIAIKKIDSGLNVPETFKKIAEVTKFNVVFKHADLTQSNTSNGNQNEISIERINWFDSKSVFFYGSTVGELINYLASSLDLFIDIDYDRRLIIVSKYKTKFFKLSVNNIQINGSVSDGDVKNETTDNAKAQDSLTREYNADVFGELEEKLDKILEVANGGQNATNAKGYFVLNKITGDIAVRTTPTMMKDVEKVIENFNDTFSKKAKVILTIYDILLNQTQNMGIDLDYSYVTDKAGAGLLTALDTANPITMNWKDSKNTLGIDANSNNIYGKILGVKQHVFTLTNHIPYSKDQIQVEKYIAKETTTTSGSGADAIIETSQEIADALDGYNIVLLPFIKGDTLSINANISLSKTVDKVEKSVSATTKITTPTESSDKLSGEWQIKKGGRMILGSLNTYEKSTNYEGKFPIENFIIGGKTNDGIVQKETVFVFSYMK